MESIIFPPQPPSIYNNNTMSNVPIRKWETVTSSSSQCPCPRSLHSAAVWGDKLLTFGGYDGSRRLNDFYAFNFTTEKWSELAPRTPPNARDRHSAVVYGHGFFVFGGFDGTSRVNDLHEYDLFMHKWRIIYGMGSLPSPRHSHAAVVYGKGMYVYAGYDGNYCTDLHRFDFDSKIWSKIEVIGEIPRGRYRCVCVVYKDQMIIHGGHDGTVHLSDTYIFTFKTNTWKLIETSGNIPCARDSHSAVVHDHSMYIYGGSNGAPLDDFYELDLNTFVWQPVINIPNYIPSSTRQSNSPSINITSSTSNIMYSTNNENPSHSYDLLSIDGPKHRFCHVGVVYDSCFYVFGGYDGVTRLNSLNRFSFDNELKRTIPIPTSTLENDLLSLVNNEIMSDITFIIQNKTIKAHRILCLRCPYFKKMLTGEYLESRSTEINIQDVDYDIFLLILQYIYCDSCEAVTVDNAMEVFQAADRFGLDRLKRVSENVMISFINIDTAASIYLAADMYNAENLKNRCKQYILKNFDQVSRSSSFEEMGRQNVDLVFEILRSR